MLKRRQAEKWSKRSWFSNRKSHREIPVGQESDSSSSDGEPDSSSGDRRSDSESDSIPVPPKEASRPYVLHLHRPKCITLNRPPQDDDTDELDTSYSDGSDSNDDHIASRRKKLVKKHTILVVDRLVSGRRHRFKFAQLEDGKHKCFHKDCILTPRTVANILNHSLKHDPTRYPCTEENCDNSYKRPYALRRHMFIAHNIELPGYNYDYLKKGPKDDEHNIHS